MAALPIEMPSDDRVCAASSCARHADVLFLVHDTVELPRCREHAQFLRAALQQSLPSRSWREAPPAQP